MRGSGPRMTILHPGHQGPVTSSHRLWIEHLRSLYFQLHRGIIIFYFVQTGGITCHPKRHPRGSLRRFAIAPCRGRSVRAIGALGKRVIVGAYEYELEQVRLDWYLQSDLFEGAADYPAVVAGAMLAWHADLSALHNRL